MWNVLGPSAHEDSPFPQEAGRARICFATQVLQAQESLGLSFDECAYLCGSQFGAGSDTVRCALSSDFCALAHNLCHPERLIYHYRHNGCRAISGDAEAGTSRTRRCSGEGTRSVALGSIEANAEARLRSSIIRRPAEPPVRRCVHAGGWALEAGDSRWCAA